MDGSGTDGTLVWIGQGARRVEARLVAEVRAWQGAVREDPALLARPLCILVPSRSLKDHLSATLVGEVGTLAGVSVQTHYGTALQILARAGRRPPAGSQLVPVLVRQLASGVAVLRADLEDLDDGYGAVAEAVSDLLDAGLDEATAAPVRELLDAAPGGGGRAAGVVEVALALRAELRGRGLGRLADVIASAREALEASPEHFAPGRVILYGFADATALVSDFLAAVLRGRRSLVLLDRPPDPVDPAAPDLGAIFGQPFEAAMAMSAAGPPEVDPESPPPRELRFFRAPGSDAEVRAVARRILQKLSQGARPESIGVVTRTPAAYAAPLRVQLGRLGVPFSGLGVPGPRSRLGRQIAFVLDLLRQRERMPADRFVGALRRLPPGARADLRLGVHALGVARLGDLASPRLTAPLGREDSFPLPVRRGLATGGGEEGGEDGEGEDEPRGQEPRGPHARRRRLTRGTLEQGGAAAREVCARLEGADRPEPLGERMAGLRTILEEGLGWRERSPEAALLARLEALGEELPRDLPVTLVELALVLDRALASAIHEPLGGKGAGVQVLDVTQARARTFEHLFLMGLNRDHFPRVISEDPLLPDDLRRQIQTVLPDLPVKERGHDEERFLFAELVSASPDVTLSWQILGDDGKAKAPSPLVDRLLTVPEEEIERVSTALAAAETEAPEHPAHEWALLAGLHGTPEEARALLPVALSEARGEAALPAVAAVRSQAVAELDAYRTDDPLLGPYFGHVGAPSEEADLRRGELFVTHVESVARCPWQGFLSRMLRLERPPDALEALPEADNLLKGSLVHAVLERIVKAVIPTAPLAEALPTAAAIDVAWPDDGTLDSLLQEEAQRLLFERGMGVPGFAALLAEVVRPYLMEARALDWSAGPVPVLGAEVEAAVEVPTPQGSRTLRFRADRVDRVAGSLRLTDYKSGAGPSDGVRANTRADKFLAKVQAGDKLQAAAYAALAPDATGRFLFLRPDLPGYAREFSVGPEDVALREAFAGAVGRVGAALDAGTFPPRLVKPDGEEGDACRWCELTAACLRGDSGARRRLSEWVPPGGDEPRARALRGIWRMGEEA